MRDLATGEVHSCPEVVGEILTRHWAPVFASAPSPSAASLRPFLEVCPKLPAGEVIEPLTFAEFCEVTQNTKSSAPGPDGLPYAVWELSGPLGAKILYDLYLQAITDGPLLEAINPSLMVFIPRVSLGVRPDAGDGVAEPGGFRPISLSNTAHKLVAKGLNATLEKLAARLVHTCQRGFVAGRNMLEHIVRTVAPMHRAPSYDAMDVGIVLFDIKAAFPSLGWAWIWAVLEEMNIPAWLITALRALYEGSTARIVFGGVVTDAFFGISRGIKQGCPSSGSVWALAFDPAVRLL